MENISHTLAVSDSVIYDRYVAILLDQDNQEELAASFSTATALNAIRAGARGYLLKGADLNGVLSVIRAVTEGKALISLAIAMQLTNYF